MRSGIAIVEMWEGLMKRQGNKTANLDCNARNLLIEFIETALDEAYTAGQNRVMELVRRQTK
jgi:hypothetical protein